MKTKVLLFFGILLIAAGVYSAARYSGSYTSGRIGLYLPVAREEPGWATDSTASYNSNFTIIAASMTGILQGSLGAQTTMYVLNQNTLQSGATFYVSSGNAVNLTASTGTFTTIVNSSGTSSNWTATNGIFPTLAYSSGVGSNFTATTGFFSTLDAASGTYRAGSIGPNVNVANAALDPSSVTKLGADIGLAGAEVSGLLPANSLQPNSTSYFQVLSGGKLYVSGVSSFTGAAEFYSTIRIPNNTKLLANNFSGTADNVLFISTNNVTHLAGDSFTVNAGSTITLMGLVDGFLFIESVTDTHGALFYIRHENGTVELQDTAGIFSNTAGTANSFNVYVNGNTTVFANLRATDKTMAFQFIGIGQ